MVPPLPQSCLCLADSEQLFNAANVGSGLGRARPGRRGVVMVWLSFAGPGIRIAGSIGALVPKHLGCT